MLLVCCLRDVNLNPTCNLYINIHLLVEEMKKPLNLSENKISMFSFSEVAGSLWWLIYIYSYIYIVILYFPIGDIGVLVISFVYCVSHLPWQWSANHRVMPQTTVKGKDHGLVCQSAEGVRWPKTLVKKNRILFFFYLLDLILPSTIGTSYYSLSTRRMADDEHSLMGLKERKI